MPTRKQRRRRQKGRRHEYEFVYVDDEGNEVEVAPDELQAERRANKTNGRARPRASNRPAVPPPSWRRVGKRALIFAPLMFLVITLLYQDELSPLGRVAVTAQMLLLFLPFSYLMDTLTYRLWRRRNEGAGATAKR